MLDSHPLWRNCRMRTKSESSQAWLSESIVTQPSVKAHAKAGCWRHKRRRSLCEPWWSWDFATGHQRLAFNILQIVITSIRWHLTFRIVVTWYSNLNLRPQNAAPGEDVSTSSLVTPLSSRQNHKFASSYAYSQISWSRSKLQKLSYWHILQNKNRSCTCSEMLNPVPHFSKHSIQSYAALPVAVVNASKPQLL